MRTLRTKVAAALLASLVPVAVWAGPVDINSADADTLAKELEGIGLARAQAIVEYRQQNGPFQSAEDLKRVSGVGDKVLEKNRGNIIVGKTRGDSGRKTD